MISNDPYTQQKIINTYDISDFEIMGKSDIPNLAEKYTYLCK